MKIKNYLKKYNDVFNGIRDKIKEINSNECDYEKDCMKISEGINVNKTNLSKECDICHYWYFKDIDFKYEPYLCNGCHDLMQKSMGFNNIAIVYIKESAYRIHFWHMSKDDAINTMNGSNLADKKSILYFFIIILFCYI